MRNSIVVDFWLFSAVIFGILLSYSDALSYLEPIIPPDHLLKRIPVRKAAIPCDEERFRKCQISFNKRLNISLEDIWTDYNALVNYTDTILHRGVDNGLLTLCNARLLLYQCLGATYPACISRFRFLRQGFSQRQAVGFIEVFKELEFMCTGGILQSINQWDCIKVYKKQSDEMYNKCLEQYHENIESSPNEVCRAALSMALCARMPYNFHCGNDVGWWECERVRIALDIDSYCPTMNCFYQLAEQEAIFEQKNKLKQDNPYFMPAG
uniref:DUF19 domain-containing protein n=1 Tax=Syphacia muris TaxID=451379 RepID=A0A0N5AWN9_9BILA